LLAHARSIVAPDLFHSIKPADLCRASLELLYAGLREASHQFREGVTRLFFDVHPKLPGLIRQFGVF